MSKLSEYFLDLVDSTNAPMLRRLSPNARAFFKVVSVKRSLFKKFNVVTVLTGISVDNKIIMTNDPVALHEGDMVEFTQEGIDIDLSKMISVSGRDKMEKKRK